MSEPKAKAKRIERVVPDVWRWSVQDERIGGGESDAYAVVDEGRVVLIDPLPIEEAPLRALGEIHAIVLTAGNHQRSCWRFRKLFGARVYAPENYLQLDEEPDHTYSGGDLLPGGLMAFHAPGPTEAMYALWKSRPVSTVFISDLLAHPSNRPPTFVPARYQDEPARTRSSVRRLIDDIPMVAVCFAHGPPIVQDAKAALERALADDHELEGEQPSP